MRKVEVSRTILTFVAAALVLAVLPTQVAAQGVGPYQYHSLTPCRLADTRTTTPPILSSAQVRTFQIRALCGVPAEAKAVSINITAIRPNGPGYITLWPTGIPMPVVSSINFAANEPAIANGAIVPLADVTQTPQDLSVYPYVAVTGGTIHLVLDVTGYFQ